MKKTIMAIGLILFAVCGVFAQVSAAGQTLRYTYLYTVDTKTEVRYITEAVNRFMRGESYITFTKNSCYRSDSNGIRRGGYLNYEVFIYQGEQNDMLVFLWSRDDYRGKAERYLYFSKDYKRINYTNAINGHVKVEVYEQPAPPLPAAPAGPVRMW